MFDIVKTLTGSGCDGQNGVFVCSFTLIDLHVSALTKGAAA
jgi:hypothetical protein